MSSDPPRAFAHLGDKLDLRWSEESEKQEAVLDPLPSYEPPSNRELVGAEELAAQLRGQDLLHVAGCSGSAAAWVARALAHDDETPVVCVAATTEEAQRHRAALSLKVFDPDTQRR